MFSDRLRYQPVDHTSLDAFHSLVIDEHVRRYLMDGNVFLREWGEDRIRESQELFKRRGIGIWLVYHKTADELVGFCGFLEIPSIHADPQLVYAMFERYSGKGFATEMAQTAIAQARKQPGYTEIVAGVDQVNGASLRVLEKLGFERFAIMPGSFGNMFLLRLRDSPR